MEPSEQEKAMLDKVMKSGCPIGDFQHFAPHLDIGSIGHKTDLGRQLATLSRTQVLIDTEASLNDTKGVVHVNTDESTTQITQALRDAAKNGAKMVVVDSKDAVEPFEYRNALNPQVKKSNMAAAMVGMAAGMAGMGGWDYTPASKPMRKCLLPGCEVMHSHNGGYCKADHCREHQAILKGKK